jgi:hypothetical protein
MIKLSSFKSCVTFAQVGLGIGSFVAISILYTEQKTKTKVASIEG